MSALPTERRRERRHKIVFLHGFTQTRESWRQIAGQLANDHEVALLDLPGHGVSTARPSTLDEAGSLIAEASTDSVLIGYSMGARLALHAALQPSQRLHGLVLIGAHPGIVDEKDRLNRLAEDRDLASRIEEIGTRAFLDEWLRQPMFEGIRDLDNEDRYGNSPDGLAYALRTLGTGNQRVLDDEMRDLTMPVLVITGELDVKFTGLTERFRNKLPNATIVSIPDAGHACHLERPDATLEEIERWLGELRKGDSDRQ